MTQITIPNVPVEVEYAVTSSSTGPFTVPFPFFKEEDVQAEVTNVGGVVTPLVVTTDFTFTSKDVPVGQEGNGYEGGTITLNVAIGDDGDSSIRIFRNTVIQRTANFPNTGPFSMPLLNDEQNNEIMILQEFQHTLVDQVADIEQNAQDIATNADGIATNAAGIIANTALINGLAYTPISTPLSLNDVRRYGLATTNTGNQNYTALVTAVAAGIPLDFQEMYPMSLDTADGETPIEYGSGLDFHWYSSTGEGGLTFDVRNTPDSNYVQHEGLIRFINAGDVLVEDMKFIAPVNDVHSVLCSPAYAGVDAPDLDVDSLTVRRCRIHDNIVMLNFRGEQDVFPSVAWFGVREILFEDNYIDNAISMTCYLRHIPSDRIIIRRNRWKNINHMPIQAGISNGVANGTDIFDFKKLFIAEDNSVINDIDFWSTATVGSYLGIALFEGYEAVVKRNHMEGCKTAQTNMLVYLSYLSCLHVTECDNVYLNNAHTDRPTTRNTLMKSKGTGIATSTELGSRTYRGNKYTVSEKWVSDIGKLNSDIIHSLYEFPSADIPTVDVVEGNQFDLIGIQGADAATASHQVHSASWSDNQIRAVYWESYLGPTFDNTAIIYISKGNQGPKVERTISMVARNTFHVDDPITGSGANYFLDAATDLGTIVVIDNHLSVEAPQVSTEEMTMFRGPFFHEKAVLSGNTINGSSMIPMQSRANILNAKINEVDYASSPGGFASRLYLPAVGRGSNMKFRLYGDHAVRIYFPWDFGIAELPDIPDPYFPDETANKYLCRCRMKRSDASGWQEVTFEYEFYWSVADTNYRVAFTSSSDVAIDEEIDSGVNNTTPIKLLTNIGTSSALITSIQLRNLGNEEYFRPIPDWVGNDNFLEIEVEVV